jgi:phosphatidylglycerophosphatase C
VPPAAEREQGLMDRPVEARSLAVFDLDGTVTRRDTLLPYIVGFLLRHPWRCWRLPRCLGPLLRYLLGERDRGRLKGDIIRMTLGGVPRASLELWSRRFCMRLLRRGLYAEALECIGAHRRAHAHLVLLSASPDLYVPAVAAALGFDECICTAVRWRPDETLDGSLAGPNRRGAEKTRCVTTLLREQQPLLSYAYGNSDADLDHMKLVNAGTYVNGAASEVAAYPNIHAVRWHKHGVATPVV